MLSMKIASKFGIKSPTELLCCYGRIPVKYLHGVLALSSAQGVFLLFLVSRLSSHRQRGRQHSRRMSVWVSGVSGTQSSLLPRPFLGFHVGRYFYRGGARPRTWTKVSTWQLPTKQFFQPTPPVCLQTSYELLVASQFFNRLPPHQSPVTSLQSIFLWHSFTTFLCHSSNYSRDTFKGTAQLHRNHQGKKHWLIVHCSPLLLLFRQFGSDKWSDLFR